MQKIAKFEKVVLTGSKGLAKSVPGDGGCAGYL